MRMGDCSCANNWTHGRSRMPSTSISGDLIRHVRKCLDLSLEHVASGRGARHGMNAHSIYAYPAYICAVAAVEAFLNESLFGRTSQIVCSGSELWSHPDLERKDLRTRLTEAPRMLFGSALQKGDRFFQEFDTLVGVRNDLTHYKMDEVVPDYVEALDRRGVAIRAVNSLGADYLWVDKVSSVRGVQWANNTAAAMVDALVGAVPVEHRDLLCIGASNFVRITDCEYRAEWLRVVGDEP